MKYGYFYNNYEHNVIVIHSKETHKYQNQLYIYKRN